MKAKVSFVDGALTVINRNSQDWWDVTFSINGTKTNYLYRCRCLHAGGTYTLEANLFRNMETGEVYDPADDKPRGVVIMCNGGRVTASLVRK